MMLFDVKNMNIYNVTSSKEGLLKRDAFGVVSRNNTIVVVGGYEIAGNELKEISSAFVETFHLSLTAEKVNLSSDTLFGLLILLVIPISLVVLTIIKYRGNSLKQESGPLSFVSSTTSKNVTRSSYLTQIQKQNDYLSTISSVKDPNTQNSRSMVSDGITIDTKIYKISESVALTNVDFNQFEIKTITTLDPTSHLAVPLYLMLKTNVDYKVHQELTVGGFGII
jgi:hypothetical protein